jgi:DNA-binding NtrC family response regulator
MDRRRILIIHADPSARATLATMLFALGYNSVDVITPDAVYQMPPCRPDLILLGFDLARADAVRLLAYTHRRFPSTPIILLANSDQDSWIRRVLCWGATAVLRFPLPASQVQAAVVQALDTTKACSLPEPQQRDEPTIAGGASLSESPVECKPREELTVAGRAAFNEPHVECKPRDELSVVGRASFNKSSERTPEVPLGGDAALVPLSVALERPERETILRTLRACGWSRNETATVLEISRSTLYKKMKKLGLFDPHQQPHAGIGVTQLSVACPAMVPKA